MANHETDIDMKSLTAIITIAMAPIMMPTLPAHSAGLQGTWRGSGYINPTNGARERVRCVVSYSRVTSRVFSVGASCASNSGSVRQTGELLRIRDSLYVGDFYNQQFNIRGRVRVQVRGGRQTVTFSSSDGGGRLTLTKR